MARNASWLATSPPSRLPSQVEAALAIAILQSKPVHIPAREYILRIRKQIQRGPSPHAADKHYLDLVGYWQEQCRRSEQECENLRTENVKLERSNHILSRRASLSPDGRPSTACAADTSAAFKQTVPGSPSKGSRRRKPPSKLGTQDATVNMQDAIESDFDLYESLGDDGVTLIKGIHTTHQLCRASNTQPDMLCKSLLRTTSALSKVVRIIATNHERLSRQSRRASGPRSLGDDKSDFALALTASARAFMSVLVGVTRMMEISNDDRLSMLVICGLVDMFQATLLAMDSCAHRAADIIALAPDLPKKNKPGHSPKKGGEPASVRSIAHFLLSLLGTLDAGNPVHHKLFDGFMFLLLERVGMRLHYCTFGVHRGNNLIPSPRTDATSAREKGQNESEQLGIRFEVKALVLILQRAMGLAPHHMKQPSGKESNSGNPTRLKRTLSLKTLPSAPKARLSAIAKDRLQRTLITCMYGGNTDDEFLDVLTRPVPNMRASSLQNASSIDDEDVEQWYKEEIWRLVGWDILAREGGW